MRLVTAALLGAALAVSSAAPAQMLRATTEGGALQGKRDGAVSAFLGIPYAASTAGTNRWRAPQPAPRWTGVRQAVAFGPNCMQGPPYTPPGGTPWTAEYLPVGPMSEDCLSLNIWTPAKRASDALPVMVWVHGGGFVGGSSTVPIYRGAALAGRGIVVVTINYRVGPFGFLAHPALTAEAGTSGNYGLMDQVAALQWVRRNAAAFGGDPARVTLAGQSAGAASTHYLLAAPSSRGLFGKVVAESGSGMGLDMLSRKQAEALGAKLAAAAGAPDLAALRAVPADAILKAASDRSLGPPGPKFRPIVDGRFLADPAAERSDVPVLTGLNADEASAGNPEWSAADPASLAALLANRFGGSAAAFGTIYRGSDAATIRAAAQQALRDRGLAALRFWYETRPPGAAPVFGYLYTHPEPGPDAARFGAFHSSEIPYVFGTLDAAARPYTPDDRRISDTLARYWVNFVRSGDPNGAGLPAWPRLGSGNVVVLDAEVRAAPALSPGTLDAYRGYVARGGKLGLF